MAPCLCIRLVPGLYAQACLCQLFSRHVGVIARIDTTRMQVGGTKESTAAPNMPCNIVLDFVATHFALGLDLDTDHRAAIVAHEATVGKTINGEETLGPCASVPRLTWDSSMLKYELFDQSQLEERNFANIGIPWLLLMTFGA